MLPPGYGEKPQAKAIPVPKAYSVGRQFSHASVICFNSLSALLGAKELSNFALHKSSVMRFPSLGGALMIKETGGEPILQMTCRDRNRLALQADLLFAYSRGIENVLCLTGDSIVLGNHKTAKSVFDLGSCQLVAAIRTMENGKDMASNDLDGAVAFYAGAIVTPEAEPLEPQLIKFEKKIEPGPNSSRPRRSTTWTSSKPSWTVTAQRIMV
jgi:5,10-methylenetetrahydrofolate reductase